LVISRVAEIEIEASPGVAVLAITLVALSALRLGGWQGCIGASLLLASLLLHEAGHLAMAQALGVRVRAVGLCLKGAYLHRSESRSATAELLIAVAGPAVSFLLYAILKDGNATLRWVAILNLVLAISNMIPVQGTDGCRICQSLRCFARRPAGVGESARTQPPAE
jgi:Zn-dependent protease